MTNADLTSEDVGGESASRQQIDLFLVSFLALFLELLLIRWIPSYERVIAYFTNFVLISAFLGLGIGAVWKGRPGTGKALRFLAPLLCALVFTILAFNRYIVTSGVPKDLFYTDFTRGAKLRLLLPECLAFFFVFVAVVFIPIGQSVAGGLASVKPPLRGYTINLLGIVGGIVAFSAMSLFSLGPWWWFMTAWIVLLWLTRRARLWLVLNCAIAFVTTTTVWWAGQNFVWTPYNKLTIRPVERKPDGGIGPSDQIVNPRRVATLRQTLGFNLAVNDDFYQQAYDGRPSTIQAHDLVGDMGGTYNLPYETMPNLALDDVLVVGAGTGNDVAAALRHGAKHVDAVEIDPGIYRLGKLAHPEQPYSDPRAQVFVDDARSFFNNTKHKYNLVVFGLLDAHGLFSSMSSVRLDSFVYTVESFGEVRRLLKDDGVVYVQHALGAGYLNLRMYMMLHTVFGSSTRLTLESATHAAFFAGPGVPQLDWQPDDSGSRIELATDDWPFFYLAGRAMPPEYRQALEFMLLLSLLLISLVSPAGVNRIKVHFFALGAAFMLIETVSVTRFALLFGSTWIINSVVFTAVLLVVLLANLWMSRIEAINIHALYACLAGSVLLNLFFPIHDLLVLTLPARLVVAMTMMATPIFFAAFIFARSYKQTDSVPLAYASNLLGAVVGGLLEYSSLLVGFRNQLLHALLLYGLSYVALLWVARKATTVAA